jgi:hypothetical protein
MYSESITHEFMVIQESVDMLNATLTAELDEINGAIKLEIKGKDKEENFVGNITIRRTSSESNFTI